jgi:hypothetical protein
MCIVDAGMEQSTRFLEHWRHVAVEDARSHAARDDWARATDEAELAQALCPGLDAEVLALLRLVYEHNGRGQRADGLVVMARRSRGESFAAEVVTMTSQLRVMLR